MAYHPLLEQQIKASEQSEASINKALLEAISATYARTLKNNTEQTTQERIERQNTALFTLSNSLADNPIIDDALKDISYSCAQTLNACRTGIWVFNDDESQLECDHEYDCRTNTFLEHKSISTDIHPDYFAELATKRVMATRDAINHKGNTTQSRQYLQTHSIKTMLDTPIKADGFYIGVLRVYQLDDTRYWHPDEQQYVASIADMIALMYQRHRRQAALEALNESENRFKALAQSTGAAIFAFRETIIYANQAAEKLTQLDQASLKLLPISVIFGSDFSTQFNDHTLLKKPKNKGIEIEFSRSSGEIRWAYINVTQTHYAGQQTWLASAFDITERKRAEIQMRYQAFHDNLTSLPNRTLLIEKIDHCLNKASRDRYYRFAICQVTVQNIKDLNQQIGHSAGDHYLIDFALRLKKMSHITDSLAKTTQDTFILVKENLHSKDQFIQDCQILYSQLNQEVTLEENTICLPITMGLVYCDHHYNASEDVLRHASIATEQALLTPQKNIHANICVFNAIMHQNFKQQKELATRLRKALKAHEFSLRYWLIQPLHATSSKLQNGIFIEPLIQWREGNAYRLNEGHFLLTQKDPHFMRSLSYWLIKSTLTHCASQSPEFDIKIWLDLTHNGFDQADEFEKLISFIGQERPKNCTVILQIPFSLALHYSVRNTVLSTTEGAISDTASVVQNHTTERDESPLQPVDNRYKALQNRLQKNNCLLGLDISQCSLSNLSILQNLPLSHVKLLPQNTQGLQPQSPSTHLLQAFIHYCQSLGLNLFFQKIDDDDMLKTVSHLTEKMAASYGQGQSVCIPTLPCELFNRTQQTG